MKKIPSYLYRCFWSYNPARIDIKRYRELVITQVLNYGDWKGIKWLFKTYPRRTIKYVIRHPSRGVWFEDVLNFWLKVFRLRIPTYMRAAAKIEMDPAKVDYKALARYMKERKR